MLLEKVMNLKGSIEEYRETMHKLAKEKGLCDPEVIKVSQQLDAKIIILQKILIDYKSNGF